MRGRQLFGFQGIDVLVYFKIYLIWSFSQKNESSYLVALIKAILSYTPSPNKRVKTIHVFWRVIRFIYLLLYGGAGE